MFVSLIKVRLSFLLLFFFFLDTCYSQLSTSRETKENQNIFTDSTSQNLDRILIPGDQISYAVLEDANAGLSVTPQTLRVKADGTISVPIQGPKGIEFTLPPIKAQGLRLSELRDSIKKVLDKEYYNDATVSLNLLSFGGSIEVMGEVNSPGTYDLPPDRRLTITAAIARAGGFTQFANQRKVELRRKQLDGKVEKLTIDVRQIQKTGQGNIVLQHGDEINVKQIGILNFN
jgi:protein involved in polysaccharide export with SLBB domain